MGGRARTALTAGAIVLALGAAAAACTPLLREDRPAALQYLALAVGVLDWIVMIPASLLVRPLFATELIAPPLSAWTARPLPLAPFLAATIAAACLWALVAWLLYGRRRIVLPLGAASAIALALTLLQLPYLTPESRAPLSARMAAALTSPVSSLLARLGVPELFKPGSGYIRRMSLPDSTAAHFWAAALALFGIIMIIRTLFARRTLVSLLFTVPLLAAPTETVQWPAGISYSYDGAGSVSATGSDEFVYDDAGRLVQAKVNNLTRRYDYDAFGNRTNCMQSDGTACQFGYGIHPNDNHLTGPVAYDPLGSGNLTRLGAHNYAYDAVNMLITDSGAGTEFLYTAGDERIGTHTVNAASWQWSVRDIQGRVLRQFSSGEGTSGWQWSRDYIWRDDRLAASRQPATDHVTTYHYHVDHLGTPRRITNETDDIVAFHDYHAFGPEVAGGLTEPSPNPLQYAAQERDPAAVPNTLDYLHARYYNPAVARFLTIDPVVATKRATLHPQAWNRYAYAENNPLTLRDPDGRQAQDATNAAEVKAAFDALPPKTREDLLRAFSIVSGGFAYLSSGGDEARVHARDTLKNAAIGVAIMTMARAIPEIVKDMMDRPLPPPATPPAQNDPCETPPAPAPAPDSAPPDGW